MPDATPASPRGDPCFLTIGMATCDDYDGCYFTIQAIRLFQAGISDEIEILVIDNNSSEPCADALKDLENSIPNYRYVPHRSRQGTAVRDLVFREAAGDWVLCVDSHVYFSLGALPRLIEYCRSHPGSRDLLQGPLLGDDLQPMATHFRPVWSHGMYGVWDLDERGENPDAPPFEVPMQGLGVFACRREAWPGFNPRLSGFGGEEGYIHEKIRRAGGRNLCLPFLRWMHRFERPLGVSYPSGFGDRIRNYLLIHHELGLDPQPVIDHFTEFLGEAQARPLIAAAQAEISGPFHVFDAIYCAEGERLSPGMERKIRWFPPGSSHRDIVAEAKTEQLESLLIFSGGSEPVAYRRSDFDEILRGE